MWSDGNRKVGGMGLVLDRKRSLCMCKQYAMGDRATAEDRAGSLCVGIRNVLGIFVFVHQKYGFYRY